jgi:acetoin utilization protein AcuB
LLSRSPLARRIFMSPLVPEVSDVMTPGPHFIAAIDTLAAAKRLMEEYGIRHLPVMRDNDLVGVLSDRDVNRALALKGAPPESITVEDAMTAEPYAVLPNTLLNVVARTMAERKIGSAVVIERGAILGVLTTTDALNALADALEGKDIERAYESVPTAPPLGRRAHEPDLR